MTSALLASPVADAAAEVGRAKPSLESIAAGLQEGRYRAVTIASKENSGMNPFVTIVDDSDAVVAVQRPYNPKTQLIADVAERFGLGNTIAKAMSASPRIIEEFVDVWNGFDATQLPEDLVQFVNTYVDARGCLVLYNLHNTLHAQHKTPEAQQEQYEKLYALLDKKSVDEYFALYCLMHLSDSVDRNVALRVIQCGESFKLGVTGYDTTDSAFHVAPKNHTLVLGLPHASKPLHGEVYRLIRSWTLDMLNDPKHKKLIVRNFGEDAFSNLERRVGAVQKFIEDFPLASPRDIMNYAFWGVCADRETREGSFTEDLGENIAGQIEFGGWDYFGFPGHTRHHSLSSYVQGNSLSELWRMFCGKKLWLKSDQDFVNGKTLADFIDWLAENRYLADPRMKKKVRVTSLIPLEVEVLEDAAKDGAASSAAAAS